MSFKDNIQEVAQSIIAVVKQELDRKINKPQTASNGDVLTFDSTTNTWKAETPGGGSLPTAQNENDILYWTGSAWTTGAITNVIPNGDNLSY